MRRTTGRGRSAPQVLVHLDRVDEAGRLCIESRARRCRARRGRCRPPRVRAGVWHRRIGCRRQRGQRYRYRYKRMSHRCLNSLINSTLTCRPVDTVSMRLRRSVFADGSAAAAPALGIVVAHACRRGVDHCFSPVSASCSSTMPTSGISARARPTNADAHDVGARPRSFQRVVQRVAVARRVDEVRQDEAAAALLADRRRTLGDGRTLHSGRNFPTSSRMIIRWLRPPDELRRGRRRRYTPPCR